MRLLRDCVSVCVLAALASAGAAAEQPSVARTADQAAPAATAAGEAPVEVRNVLVTPAGASVTLVNRSTQPIAAYLVGLTYSGDPEPQRFKSMTSNWGARWPAGDEIRLLLPSSPSDDPARVIVRAVVLADGTGYGDRETVNRVRSDWDRRRAGLSGALALLDMANVPATEEELQALIEQVALSMARVPTGRGGESVLQPYVQVIGSLKGLQGRDIVGTDRLAREMSRLADTMGKELAAVPGVPASAAR